MERCPVERGGALVRVTEIDRVAEAREVLANAWREREETFDDLVSAVALARDPIRLGLEAVVRGGEVEELEPEPPSPLAHDRVIGVDEFGAHLRPLAGRVELPCGEDAPARASRRLPHRRRDTTVLEPERRREPRRSGADHRDTRRGSRRRWPRGSARGRGETERRRREETPARPRARRAACRVAIGASDLSERAPERAEQGCPRHATAKLPRRERGLNGSSAEPRAGDGRPAREERSPRRRARSRGPSAGTSPPCALDRGPRSSS